MRERTSLLVPDAVVAAAGYTVADLCRRWRVGEDKVRTFLRRGELVGVNVAAALSGRPQWRITPESVEQFERRRSSAPPPKAPRSRKRNDQVDYYPD
jgi:Helix-turn-helix domain